jgi:hypothetical protein
MIVGWELSPQPGTALNFYLFSLKDGEATRL